jgi:DNA recombination protein RmuC
MSSILLFSILSFIAGIVISLISKKKNSTAFQEIQTKFTVSENLLQVAKAEKQTLQQQIIDLQQDLKQATATIAVLNTRIAHYEEKLTTQKDDLLRLDKELEIRFNELAGRILEEKSKSFSEQQEHNLKNILEPLRQNIQTFKHDFELRYNDESKERASLKEQIKLMMELNNTLSSEAKNLTQALRGQVKQQGNWGEMILESILQYTGLQKGIHYEVQHSDVNDEGKTIQPDIVVMYPDDRKIIIDSKVSLVHYDNYASATDAETQKTNLELLLRSIKVHIDGLGSKSYQDVNSSLDFVLMFIPLEAAYITAMQADTTLWQYAYNKRILMLSPTNLVAAMKLVNDMWQRDAINKDAHKLAEKAGKLYDKLVGFVENLDKVGQQLDKAQATWQYAYKQLNTGRGNLISQAEQMKIFRVKTARQLPSGLVEQALAADNVDETAISS